MDQLLPPRLREYLFIQCSYELNTAILDRTCFAFILIPGACCMISIFQSSKTSTTTETRPTTIFENTRLLASFSPQKRKEGDKRNKSTSTKVDGARSRS